MAFVVPFAPLQSASADLQAPGFDPFPPPPGDSISVDTQNAAGELAKLVEASPGSYTGVRVTGPGAVTVTLPSGADFKQRADTLRSGTRSVSGETVSVAVEQVPRSLADVEATKAQIVELITAGAYKNQVFGVGVDPVKATAVVYASEDSDTARTELKQRFGDAITFRLQDAVARPNTRSRDTAPHYGGAGIRMWTAGHVSYGGVCSTAFAVVKQGVAHMLSAAHCFPSETDYPRAWSSSFTSASAPLTTYYQGAMVTTTMRGTLLNPTDGTQDLYGDFSLLQGGGGYLPRVYNCAKNAEPCTSLVVGAAEYGTPANGTQVCTSGVMSGQTCRQYVTDGSYAGWINVNGADMFINHWAITNSDQNGDGTYDCAGAIQGDSGGAIYRSMAGGKVVAMGIISAGWNGPTGVCYSAYAKLSGVRAWDSSVSVLTD
ncbi:hypothetical protein [Nonomuraea sp. NPDC049141]|uniref:hypothetical protein n=1 Tax=Nonomuraea sp. NPDC049141 TaxID=3155500 RepID=UPI00340F5CEF